MEDKERRTKYRLAEKRAFIAIVVGILTIVMMVGGVGISLISWKNYQDYKTETLIKKDKEQDIRLLKVEDAINLNKQQLSAINANLNYIIRILTNNGRDPK